MIKKSFAATVMMAVLVSAYLLSAGGSGGKGVTAATAHPTITPGSSTRAWGDSDCSAEVTQRDFKSIQRVILSEAPLSQTEPCPDVGSSTHMSAPFDRDVVWGDWNCNEALDVVDVLAVHRTVSAQPPLQFGESCPTVGEQVSVTELQTASDGGPTAVVEGSATYFAVQVYLATQGLGALDLTISYDPLLVTIQNCIPSDITIECNAHFADGEVRLLATYPLGSVADTRLAEIDLESFPGGHLTWEANKATSPNASPTAAAIQMFPYNLDPTDTATPTPSPGSSETATPTVTVTPTPTGSATPVPSGETATPTAGPTPSHTFVPTPKLTEGPGVRRLADLNCDGSVNGLDILMELKVVASMQVIECGLEFGMAPFNLDCTDGVALPDVLELMYFVVQKPYPIATPSNCPPLDTFEATQGGK